MGSIRYYKARTSISAGKAPFRGRAWLQETPGSHATSHSRQSTALPRLPGTGPQACREESLPYIPPRESASTRVHKKMELSWHPVASLSLIPCRYHAAHNRHMQIPRTQKETSRKSLGTKRREDKTSTMHPNMTSTQK